MNKKSILLINTGGTISSVKTATGYMPQPGFISKKLQEISEFSHPDMPRYDIIKYDPLLDSANMDATHWNQIANDISKHYDDYDGFVILHGTDTLAYTASALSFMLNSLAKPVILTGSQIPLSELRNDAIDNLTTAMLIAANYEIPEVCVYFNNRLLRGNRSQKVNATKFKAFDSPNYPHIARIGIDIDLHKSFILPKPNKAFELQTIGDAYIANFRIFPGTSHRVLQNILRKPLQGLILETYGVGNAQNTNKDMISLLTQACNEGIIIVNCSQCQRGRVDMESYDTGQSLLKAGLISGYDMTAEAAHCKLLYLLSQNLTLDEIKLAIQQDLRGELTI